MIFSHNQKGNAILISLGVTSFIFIVAAGAGSIIDSSLRQSPKIVNAGKAFYAAEGAVESALYEAGGRASGYESSGMSIDMQRLNKTNATWSATSRTGLTRTRTEGNEHDDTLYIPPRKAFSTDAIPDANTIVSLEDNWKKVQFGKAYSFDLFVDDSVKVDYIPLGDQMNGTVYTDCDNLSIGNLFLWNNGSINVTCHTPELKEFLGGVNYCEEPQNIEGTTYSISSCTDSSTAPINSSGDSCTDSGEVLGPNGICSSETKSIFNSSTLIENIFFDVFIPGNFPTPADDEDLESPVLTWSLQAKTDGVSAEDTLELKAERNCNDGEAGFMCFKHFNGTSSSSNVSIKKQDENGAWVRLENPMGIMRNEEQIYPINIMEFSDGNITYGENNFITPLYFPRLTIQMGKKREWNISLEKKTINDAYIRIGFKFQDGAHSNLSNFTDNPIPNDNVTIQATGNSGAFEQKINVQIKPQELAPMFEYAVFQP